MRVDAWLVVARDDDAGTELIAGCCAAVVEAVVEGALTEACGCVAGEVAEPTLVSPLACPTESPVAVITARSRLLSWARTSLVFPSVASLRHAPRAATAKMLRGSAKFLIEECIGVAFDGKCGDRCAEKGAYQVLHICLWKVSDAAKPGEPKPPGFS